MSVSNQKKKMVDQDIFKNSKQKANGIQENKQKMNTERTEEHEHIFVQVNAKCKTCDFFYQLRSYFSTNSL